MKSWEGNIKEQLVRVVEVCLAIIGRAFKRVKKKGKKEEDRNQFNIDWLALIHLGLMRKAKDKEQNGSKGRERERGNE